MPLPVSIRILEGRARSALRVSFRDPWVWSIAALAAAAGWLVRDVEPWWTFGASGVEQARADLLWLASAVTVGRGIASTDRISRAWAAGSRELWAVSALLQLALVAVGVVVVVAAFWAVVDPPTVAIGPCAARACLLAAVGGACGAICGPGMVNWLTFAAMAWLVPGLLSGAPDAFTLPAFSLETRSLGASEAFVRTLVWSGLALLAARVAPHRLWR